MWRFVVQLLFLKIGMNNREKINQRQFPKRTAGRATNVLEKSSFAPMEIYWRNYSVSVPSCQAFFAHSSLLFSLPFVFALRLSRMMYTRRAFNLFSVCCDFLFKRFKYNYLHFTRLTTGAIDCLFLTWKQKKRKRKKKKWMRKQRQCHRATHQIVIIS